MPTHSLLPFVESPEGPTQDFLIRHDANTPGPGSSMTPHSSCFDTTSPTSLNTLIPCMFCDETFTHQEDLGPHVLAQHPTTFAEPTVLRVEAEFRIPGERIRPKPTLPEKEETHSCIVCGQVSQDALDLENHMRKHKDYFYYCCSVCGRRFREPWFLKAHMKMHTKSGGKSKAAQELEPPATINGVQQDPVEPVATGYKMCMVCGFFFPDHDSLAEHCKVHNREDKDVETCRAEVNKDAVTLGLNLQPSLKATAPTTRTSKWIPQLDPFVTYQAWQLATKGKIAVGLNNVKDLSQELSTDNEDSASEKEELNGVVVEGQSSDKAGKDVPSPAAIESAPLPRRRSLIQKDLSKKSIERPTTCEECQKTFRTYHQLVLHSRIHKRDRAGGDSPVTVMDSKPQGEDEEGLEEGALTQTLSPGEDGLERVKGRSKECSYCGKSFKSSYYLTVHLRTHTGEKPYKCSYCDYAAAQKTSLKYHLDRRHKDKPYLELPLRPTLPSTNVTLKQEPDSESSSSPTKAWMEEAKPLQFVKLMTNDALVNLPINLKVEKPEIKSELEDGPLNLSLKVSLSISTAPTIPNSCPQCAFKTVYPEVLVIHRKLSHRDKSETIRRPTISRLKRHTGCPPALDGKDVAPLSTISRSHPRRTKSPVAPVPVKQQGKSVAVSDRAPSTANRSPLCEDGKKSVPNVQPKPQEQMRFTEVTRRPNQGGKYILNMPTPPERIGIGERGYPVRNGVHWSKDAARLCLSNSFGSLGHVDFAEPTNKRLKFSQAESEAGEKLNFRSTAAEASSRLLMPHQAPPMPVIPDPLKGSSVTLGGALDSEWSSMNLLRSCTLSDLASLYHPTPTGNPQRTAGRTLLYQPLPALPTLQRREAPGGSFPNPRYGTADKSA